MPMDRLDAMAAFAAAVEAGSLSGAAKRLGWSLASVSRQITSTEQRLKTRLLARTTRRLALTDDGKRYYDQIKHILADIAVAESSLGPSEHPQVPHGRLHVSAPSLIGRLRLAPLMADYLAEYPRVTLELTLLDRPPNLLEDQIDIAVVIGRLPDSALIRRGLGDVGMIVCGAPDYLDSRGTPARPQDLSTHHCLIFSTMPGPPRWSFQIAGRRTEVDVPVRLRSNSLDVVVSAALGGAGLVRAPSWLVKDHIAAGKLKPILEDFSRPATPLQMIFSDPRGLSRKVQSFADFLAARWGAGLRVSP
jgi:DNA-binding transcriptional LysR family regulator